MELPPCLQYVQTDFPFVKKKNYFIHLLPMKLYATLKKLSCLSLKWDFFKIRNIILQFVQLLYLCHTSIHLHVTTFCLICYKLFSSLILMSLML